MKLDIDKAINAVAPWDFSVVVGGKDFPSIRPTIGIIARVLAMAGKSREELQSLGSEVFAGADLASWSLEAIYAGLSAYTTWFNQESLKNCRAIADNVKAAMAAGAQASA